MVLLYKYLLLKDKHRSLLVHFEDERSAREVEVSSLNDRVDKLTSSNSSLFAEKQVNESKIVNLCEEIKLLKEHKDELSELYSQHQEFMKQSTDSLFNKFQNFANTALDSNSEKFTKFSQQKLDHVLSPLKSKIENFQQQVNSYYNKEVEGRASLSAEIKWISSASQKVADSCNNLTQTLRGSQKLQGNWGELILTKVLESSGLREGEEYFYQAHINKGHDDEAKKIVDVLIMLPEKKHIVIDAKTSLKYYEAYQNSAEQDEECYKNLRCFLESVKMHIKSLSSKEYQRMNNTPEFTIMFIPIDSAFILTLQKDSEIQNFALKNNIILTSPSLLVAVLKTVASLWNLSKQNANAQKIASAAGDMYGKFCGFIDDMNKIGTSLDKAKFSYDSAFNKLYKGKGNLIRRAENIKEMGIVPKVSKSIPENIIERANTEDMLTVE